MASEFALDKATALVTGAGSGIGREVTLALQSRGVRVIACDRDESLLEKLDAGTGDRLYRLALDVTDAKAVSALPQSLPQPWQNVDILVNCAGHDIGGRRPFVNGDPDRYAAIIETNLIGVIRITHALARGMAERGRGHIVNLGSSTGLRTEASTSTYTASKHAIHGFSDCLRKDFVDSGVRVTEICPGRVRTNFAYTRAESKAEADRFYDQVGQCLAPEDIANAIVYALQQPAHVVVSQLVIMPASQA